MEAMNSSLRGGEAGDEDECGGQLALPGSPRPLLSSLTLALLVASGQPGLRPGAPQRGSPLPQVHWKDEGGMHSAAKSSEWARLTFLYV